MLLVELADRAAELGLSHREDLWPVVDPLATRIFMGSALKLSSRSNDIIIAIITYYYTLERFNL